MARFQIVVFTKAVDGRREELASWYDNQHIPDHLRVPGFVSGARHTVHKLDGPPQSPEWDFMAVYELEAEDPMTVIEEARRRLGTDDMPLSPALDMSLTLSVVATPVFSA
ncbi:hypothetical protein [Nocardia aurantia]|uniref:EthD domain-containing protein n=1 Tax=Nocardia aurantia TaxID=2585199 RepID=A0A7K0E1S5_9NOCA|nr:hypothetical protein [Nocardia aurantia]MQY31831.1 hypothetical protein [Nocardia aurantia]